MLFLLLLLLLGCIGLHCGNTEHECFRLGTVCVHITRHRFIEYTVVGGWKNFFSYYGRSLRPTKLIRRRRTTRRSTWRLRRGREAEREAGIECSGHRLTAHSGRSLRKTTGEGEFCEVIWSALVCSRLSLRIITKVDVYPTFIWGKSYVGLVCDWAQTRLQWT